MDEERVVRVIIMAPGHLTMTEIAEMFWDKLDQPDSVFTIDSVSVTTMPPLGKVPKAVFTNVNEDGETYGTHDNLADAMDELVKFPNDSVRVTLAPPERGVG